MPTEDTPAPAIHVISSGPASSQTSRPSHSDSPRLPSSRSPSTQSPDEDHRAESKRKIDRVSFATAKMKHESPVSSSHGVDMAASAVFGLIMRHRWFAWISAKLSWSHMKPVIRCALAVSPLRRLHQTTLTRHRHGSDCSYS